MAADTGFYAAQAAKCARAAAECQLPQKRAALFRAGAAWQALAERESMVAAARDRRIADAAARASADP